MPERRINTPIPPIPPQSWSNFTPYFTFSGTVPTIANSWGRLYRFGSWFKVKAGCDVTCDPGYDCTSYTFDFSDTGIKCALPTVAKFYHLQNGGANYGGGLFTLMGAGDDYSWIGPVSPYLLYRGLTYRVVMEIEGEIQ